MIADTPHSLEDHIDKALVIDRTSQLQMAKVARIGLVMQISQARVVRTAIDGLALDLSLISSDTGWNFAAIDCNGLSHRVLALQGTREKKEPAMEKHD